MGLGSEAVLYDTDGSPLAVDTGVATPADTPLLMIGGSDGTNSRYILVDSSGRQVMVGAATPGTPAGGVITIQGDPAGTPIPISGTIVANAGSGNFAVVQATASNLLASVGGLGVVGASVVGNPVRIGGSDGTNTRDILVDSSGRQIIIGAAANGAAVSGNPVLIAGSDGTNARSIRTATDGTVRVDPTGTTTQPVSGTVTANAGTGTFTVAGTVTSNIGTTGGLALESTQIKLTISPGTALGSNTLAMVGGSVTTAGPTYTNGNINALSLTTAGALRTDSSSVTQPVSGTVTANQGTANSLANAWPTKITDTTNGPVAVKAASTAPTVSDQALVVVLSPNQQSIPVTTNPVTSAPAIAAGYVLTSSITKTAVIASTYNEQTTNAQRSFKSASANDTSAGTGARTVLLTYYDQTLAGPFTETITMNGTAAVNTVSTTICYIESMVVATAGSGTVNAGIITLFVSTAGGGGTLATMNAGENRTFWANHYVGSSKTCYITGLSGHNTNSSNGSILTMTSFNPSSANQVESQISDFVRCGGGTSQPVRDYNQLIKVTGPNRIRLYETCEGTANITTRAAFDYYDQ